MSDEGNDGASQIDGSGNGAELGRRRFLKRAAMGAVYNI